ncbi:hypothetical protein MATL_G00162180 [Megalops atlanticus]|uniref:Diphthine--ammonia ligase n=1 Tax=Megalops atlanticus TaxID=7932 RepID=A0A9D3T960_MEGAT|nr:hypothetical protein MATL_G00162180 [Megalops atlanticus]
MKVVALISGGKDSCYNMMQCVAAGHKIVALANLRPAENTDELDSYMYQTVGHQAIDLYAEAMGLPLYRRTIEGTSLDVGREYSQRDGDEVEDLYHLLKLVKEKEGVEAVSVGAILSDYQRVRVENVCMRLQLQPLAYLWRRDQETLLREMISCDLHALIIKVAAFGLNPEKHLGKSLAEMESYLKQLSQKYGVHVCGEGGEYETFTLDCPLFKKKIVIDAMETVIHSADAFAPVGYLRFLKMHVEDKISSSMESGLPFDSCPCLHSIDKMTEEPEYADEAEDIQREFASDSDLKCQGDSEPSPTCSTRTELGYQWICGIVGLQCDRPNVQTQTKQAFALLQGEVEKKGLQLKHIVLVHLYVRSMEDFSAVNSVYQSYFGINPPARVCVEAPLPRGQLLQMDCLLHDWVGAALDDTARHKHVLHVQSLSHWAPANIGPYSQAIEVDEMVFCAGQIALVPCTMQLVRGAALSQASVSFGHMERVLEAISRDLTLWHALQPHCYVTRSKDIPIVKAVWERKLRDLQSKEEGYGEEDAQCGPLVVAVVPRLPRGAAVELHVIAARDDPRRRTCWRATLQVPAGTVECQVLQSGTRQCAAVSLSLGLPGSAPGAAGEAGLLRALRSSFQDALQKVGRGPTPLCARVFYKQDSALAQQLAAGLAQCLKNSPDQRGPAVALVPVLDLPEAQVLHLSCWLSL